MPWLSSYFRGKEKYPGLAQDTPLEAVRYAVVDTELTSLDTRSNRVLSIGAIAMEGTRILLGDQFYRVANPGVEVPAKSVLIHKLRPHDVEQGEPMPDVLKALREFIAGRVIVGHFVNIDLQALGKELGDPKRPLRHPAIDTARVHRWIVKNGSCSEDLVQQFENIDLATLARTYNLDFREAHHALEDAFVTARLWQKLMAILLTMKVNTLRDLFRIGQA